MRNFIGNLHDTRNLTSQQLNEAKGKIKVMLHLDTVEIGSSKGGFYPVSTDDNNIVDFTIDNYDDDKISFVKFQPYTDDGKRDEFGPILTYSNIKCQEEQEQISILSKYALNVLHSTFFSERNWINLFINSYVVPIIMSNNIVTDVSKEVSSLAGEGAKELGNLGSDFIKEIGALFGIGTNSTPTPTPPPTNVHDCNCSSNKKK